MISGIFHPGSGLGNMLHRYVAVRVLTLDKNYHFGMVAPENFKGKDFMNLDMGRGGNSALKDFKVEYPAGKIVFPKGYVWEEWDKHCYDPDINFVKEMTIIDGNFEDPRYFEHHLPEIREWLKTEELHISNGICVINFRGGEYQYVPELFLPLSYWQEAVSLMEKKHSGVQFEVHTDDPELAKKFFPNFPIIHDIGLNWRSIRYARHLILSNSSFAVLPALLNENVQEIIAPKYWNRYNVKEWAYPQNYYKAFTYI